VAEALIETKTVTADTTPGEITISTALPDSASVVYLFEGDHTEDVELLSDKSNTNGADIPSGRRWRSGPYRANASNRPKWLYASSNTSVTVHIFRDDHADNPSERERSSLYHGPADGTVQIDDADPVDVEAGYLDGRAEVDGQASEEDVDFVDPQGNSLTKTIDGNLYVDVRHFDRLTVQASAAINGGSDDTTVEVLARLIAESDNDSISSKTISSGSEDYLVQALDVSDVGWIKVEENSAGSDHRIEVLAQ